MQSLPTVEASWPATEAMGLRVAQVRGQRVLIDTDLAALYEVEARQLN